MLVLSTNFIIILISVNCGDPSSLQVNHSVFITGYMDPVLPGRSVQFSCPPTLAMSGPNSSTCLENGQWEPDPGRWSVVYMVRARYFIHLAIWGI